MMMNTTNLKNYIFILTLLFSFLDAIAQIEIPVTAQIVRTDNGALPRATSDQVNTVINKLNDAFNDMGVSFVKCSENFVDNTLIWSQFNSGTDRNKLLLDNYTVKNTVNIFITDLISGSNGRAVFPYKQKDWVIVDINKIADIETTTIHELGHYFGLHHTYSGVDDDPASSSSLTIREAEGAEGWKYGDYLIDTPLDPESRSDFDSNCNYIGDQVDANGDFFKPDGTNYMGKGHGYCRNSFSISQEKRMLEYIKKYRYYLKCNSTSNNNLSIANSAAVATFPHNDNFEREYANTFWVQARDGDDLNWRNGPNTSSNDTGANSAQSGQTFMYLEASLKYTDTDEAILLSPAFTFKNKKDISIEFYYHMHGADTGSLILEINTDKDSNWIPIFNKNGEQHNAINSPWTKETIQLNTYAENIIQFRFRAISKGSSKSDISIDNITVNASTTLSLENDEMIGLKVFPNPAKDYLLIHSPDTQLKTIKIYTLLGILVHQKETNLTNYKIDIAFLKKGTYFVQITNTDKKEAQIKLIKN
jgi:hypothetical protein